MKRDALILLIVVIVVTTIISFSFFEQQRVTSLETDRSIITTAVSDYYNRTGVVPANTVAKLVDLANKTIDTKATDVYKQQDVKKLYDYLVDVFGASDVDSYMFPVDKKLLRSAGSLSKLHKESRLWVTDTRNPAFLITPEDIDNGTIPPNSGGDLDTLVEKTVDIPVTNPVDTDVDSTGKLVVGGSGTQNRVVVSPNGTVENKSTANPSEVIEYVADGSYIKKDGTVYTFVP